MNKIVKETTLLEGNAGKIVQTRFEDGNVITQFVSNRLKNQVFSVGTSTRLQPSYNSGKSSWLQTSTICFNGNVLSQQHGETKKKEIVCPVVLTYNQSKIKKKN